MDTLWKMTARAAGGLILAAGFAAAAMTIARPGTVNYTEGQVLVDGRTVRTQSLGNLEINPGQELTTQNGKAEILLTPGSVLRVGNNSEVRMIATGLTDTRAQLLRGEALLEIDNLQKENRIAVETGGATAEVMKDGLYRFDANAPKVSVIDGKLRVAKDDRSFEIGKGKEVVVNSASLLKPNKFDRSQKDELYAWSDLRSKYMAEANASSARSLVVGGPGWYGPGWYWNSWFGTWAFMPGFGYWASPFGYTFYGPGYWGFGRPLVAVRPHYYGGGFARVPFRRR